MTTVRFLEEELRDMQAKLVVAIEQSGCLSAKVCDINDDMDFLVKLLNKAREVEHGRDKQIGRDTCT